MFLWALNEKIDGLYSNPEIRVSFIFWILNSKRSPEFNYWK
jgi:hypothetical protein